MYYIPIWGMTILMVLCFAKEKWDLNEEKRILTSQQDPVITITWYSCKMNFSKFTGSANFTAFGIQPFIVLAETMHYFVVNSTWQRIPHNHSWNKSTLSLEVKEQSCPFSVKTESLMLSSIRVCSSTVRCCTSKAVSLPWQALSPQLQRIRAWLPSWWFASGSKFIGCYHQNP